MMQRRIIVAIAIAVLGIGACIIGPKQDDPAPGGPSNESDLSDSAVSGALDGASDSGTSGDTALPPAPGDAAVDGDAKQDGDADAFDAACPDGGFRVSAIGPWNEARMCFETTTHYFDCQDGPDGGTAFTCFERISTMEKFLAPTTQIPAGSDYRTCVASLERCK